MAVSLRRLSGHIVSAIRGIAPFKAAVFFVFAIFLCALYIIGPDIQKIVASLLRSGVPGIYRSSYGNGVVTFPSLQEWLQDREYWYYAIASLLTAAIVWRHATMRRMTFAAYITTVSVLIGIDAVLCIYQGTLFSSLMFANIVFDAIGGILMTGTIILVVRLMDLLFADAPSYGVANKLLTLFCPVLVGVLIILSTYFIERSLYSPRHVEFVTFISAPVRGAISTQVKGDAPETSDAGQKDGIFSKRQFSLIRDLKDYDLITWLGDGATNVKLAPMQTSYTVYIDFFSGCTRGDLKKMHGTAKQTIKLEGVKSVNLHFDKGLTTFAMSKNNGIVSVEPNGVVQYSLTPSSKKSLDVSEFVGENAVMRAGDKYSNIYFYLIANLFTTTKDDKVIVADRMFDMTVNGIKHTFRFAGSESNTGKTVTCRLITPQMVKSVGVSGVDGTAAAYVRLIPEPVKVSGAQVGDNSGVLEISGPAGWISADNVAFSSFENFFQNDDMDYVSFSGAVKSLVVDSANVDTSQYLTYQMFGRDIQGSVDDNGIVTFRGAAKAAWAGSVRLNPTWWESLDWKIKSGLFSGVAIFLIFIAKLLKSIIVRDEPIRCLR